MTRRTPVPFQSQDHNHYDQPARRCYSEYGMNYDVLDFPDYAQTSSRCLDACSLCAALCLKLLQLFPGDPQREQCLADCARACLSAVHLLDHGLTLQRSLCDLSASLCDRCAEHCLPDGAGDLGQLAQDAARQAADAFRAMAVWGSSEVA